MQLSPTTLVQSQAVSVIRDIQKRYLANQFKSPTDISNEVRAALTDFLNNLGRPLFRYEPFVRGEPVISEKMNRIYRMMQDDINILSEQSNYIQAGTVYLYNYVTTEILKAQNQNAQASNKLKTLQLYSSAQDTDVIIFGDFFLNNDSLDINKMPTDSSALIQHPGYLTLDKVSSDPKKLLKDAEIEVLDSSNGFLGNNQELDPRSTVPTQNPLPTTTSTTSGYNPDVTVPTPTTEPDLIFRAEADRHAKLPSIIDQEPTSWIEYEYYLVSVADRLTAKGFGFAYKKPDPDDPSKDIMVDWATGPGFTLKNTPAATTNNSIVHPNTPVQGSTTTATQTVLNGYSYVPGPDAGILKLDMQVTLKEQRRVNQITLLPYPLENNKNHPILVTKVETSADASTWVPVTPANLWIANEKNLQTARIADNSVVGSGVWLFPDRTVQYIRFQIQQKNPIDSTIGHVYWLTKQTTVRSVVTDANSATPSSHVVDKAVGGERKEGPIPPVNNPSIYNDPRYTMSGDLIKKVESFNAKRWAIGVRDVVVDEVTYKPLGVIVSKQFHINGIIDRVSLEADIDIPDTFPSDEGQLWVKFFVSPDDGINWFPISRIQDDFLGIPEILAFNDPLPTEFQELGVGYHTVSGVVNSLRVKIELSRPSQSNDTNPNTASERTDLDASSTPVVRSYKLKVRKR